MPMPPATRHEVAQPVTPQPLSAGTSPSALPLPPVKQVLWLTVAGLMAGASLGLVDALDTLAGGYAVAAPAGDVALLVALSVLALAPLGALVGAALALALGLAARVGVRWESGAGLRVGRRWTWPTRLATAWGLASLCASTAVTLGMLVWLLFGSGRLSLTEPLLLAIALGGLALFGVVAFGLSRPRSPRWAAPALLAVCALGLYVIETRLVYGFSRLGPMGVVHLALLLALLALGAFAFALPAGPKRWMAARTPVQATLIVAALGLVALAAPALDRVGTQQLRLLAHERTALAF
jgi:hypothetical protein